MAGFVGNCSKAKEATNELCRNSDLDEDGVHGGRMKPLSSLGIPAKKGPNLSAKLAPSQVLTAARIGTKARHRTSSYGNAMIRIQRMHVRTKKCKKINGKDSGSKDKLIALPAWTVETSNSKNRAEHLTSTKDKDLDSASNLTCDGLEASTRVLDNMTSRSRETALSCIQEKKLLDFCEKEASPPEDSLVHSVTGLAPKAHLNLAKSREEKSLLSSTDLLKERMPDEFPPTQGDDTANSLHIESCIDPMLKNMLMSIVKAEDEDEFAAEGKDTCGVIADATPCKSIHIVKGYCDSSKSSPSSSDVLYDEFKGEKCIESSTTAEPGPFQVAGKYRHASGTKLSHATFLGPHSADCSGFTKDIKVEKIALKRFLATNSKMIKIQPFMDKKGASPQKSVDSDILKQMGELNPGIINKLRDKKQVHAALGAIIGASTANAISSEEKDPYLKLENQQRTSDDENQGVDCDHEGRPAKRRKSIDFRWRLAQMNLSTTGGFAATIPVMDMNTQATHMMAEVVMKEVYSTENLNSDSCKHVDTDARVCENHPIQASDSILKKLRMHNLENEPDFSGAKQQNDSGANCLCDQAIPCQQRSHSLRQVANKTTANAALCWLELLRLDIKGRLSALKRSRRRIRSVIVSGQLEDKMSCADDAFQKTSRWDLAGGGKRDPQTVEVDKWRAFFLHMDGVLHSEGARLENWLNQIDEMQSHCQKSSLPLNMQ